MTSEAARHPPRNRRPFGQRTLQVPVAAIAGSPTPEEEVAITLALELLVAHERRVTSVSPWTMAGRAWATRSGILDYRTRLGRSSWPVTDRLAWTGRAYDGRAGRGDSR